MGFISEKAHDLMVDTCEDYWKGFWLIEDMKSLMLVDSAERSLVD